MTAEDMAAVIEEQFFEVYNGHPSVGHIGDDQHVGLERMWDITNTLRVAEMDQPPLFGLATDDSHNYFGNRGSSPGRGWVMVKADSLEAGVLVEAIERGDFYASSGVTLNAIHATEGRLELDIQTEDGVEYVTDFVGTSRGYDAESKPVVDAEGKEIQATRRYSADVGRVFARVEGAKPAYKFGGDGTLRASCRYLDQSPLKSVIR